MAKYPYLILKEYPTYDSPLAKRIKNNPLFVERAEVYVNGMEIANMYSENTDPVYQREVFLKQVKKKEDKTIDEDFIEALEHGIPPCAGIGIGIERLCMILLGLNSIRDVIFFPAYKSK
jgi:lysyl-tRNA synthetase class 2